MAYSLSTPRGPRLIHVVRDELVVEGKAVFSAPVLLPTAPALTSLSTEALVAMLSQKEAA